MEERDMIVLSLFDGMSCGQIALKQLGVIPETYYASEIDKHAIGQTQLNFPNTIQLGSVVDVNVSDLKPIDLLIGGSPCQSFSFAGKRKGMATKCSEEIYTLDKYLQLKADGFEFEGQSYLFWEYMRILTDIRKYNQDVLFLLENVEMGNKWERILSEAIGVFGVHINSALVSAQNRKRIYWTNIRTRQEGLFGETQTDIPQPKDKGILLKDILESEVEEKYYLSDRMLRNMKQWNDTGNGIIGHSGSGGQKGSIYNDTNKMGSLCATDYKQAKQICVAMRGRNPDNPSDRRIGSPTEQRLEPNLSGKTNCLTSIQKDNLVMCLTPKRTEYGKQIRKQYESGEVSAMRKEVSQLEPREDGKTNTLTTVQKDNLVMQLNPSKESGGVQPYQQNRIYDPNGISPCLNTDARPRAIVELNERQQRNLKDVNGKADTFLSTSWKGSQANGMTLVVQEATEKGFIEVQPGECFDFENPNSTTRRGRKMEEKSNCLMAKETDFMQFTPQNRIRRLTPTECARLQTVPDWYIWACSDTQQYRMLGNGWTVAVIMHIFSFLPDKFKTP